MDKPCSTLGCTNPRYYRYSVCQECRKIREGSRRPPGYHSPNLKERSMLVIVPGVCLMADCDRPTLPGDDLCEHHRLYFFQTRHLGGWGESPEEERRSSMELNRLVMEQAL